MEGIKYFVAPKFKQNYATNREQLRRVSGAEWRSGGMCSVWRCGCLGGGVSAAVFRCFAHLR